MMGLSCRCIQRAECSLCGADLSDDVNSGRVDVRFFGAVKYYFCPKCEAKPPVEDDDPDWKKWCKKVDRYLCRKNKPPTVDNGDSTGPNGILKRR